MEQVKWRMLRSRSGSSRIKWSSIRSSIRSRSGRKRMLLDEAEKENEEYELQEQKKQENE